MAVLVLIILISIDTFMTGFLLASYRRLERTVVTLGAVQRDISRDVVKDA